MNVIKNRLNGINYHLLLIVVVFGPNIILASESTKPEIGRSNVRIHRGQLLMTIVGKPDQALMSLSYSPRVDSYEKHSSGPINMGSRCFLPAVPRGECFVYLLGYQGRSQYDGLKRDFQQSAIGLPAVPKNRQKRDKPVRISVLDLARQRAKEQQQSDDL